MTSSMQTTRVLAASWLSVATIMLAGCSSPTQDPAVPTSPGGQAAATDGSQAPAAQQPGSAPTKRSELLVQLPGELCNTADAMVLLPDGNVLVSIPNFNKLEQGSLLMKITPENDVEPMLELPTHPETGKPFGPLGICLAPSGDLFIADYQMEGERQSRVCRIKMENNQPVEVTPVVVGFHVSNAVAVRNGYLYVSETQIDTEAKPAVSGVFRFKLDELEDAIVGLAENELEDPHLIATIDVYNEELPLGADGLAFDDEGNLYVGSFSDGTVHRIQFDEDGKVTSNEIFAKADFMKSADGLFRDPQSGVIYVADSKANAVQMVFPDGSVKTLAQNGDTDGLDGGMDQPCEVLLRDGDLIVSNMDWPVPGCINQEYSEPCTISVIRLD